MNASSDIFKIQRSITPQNAPVLIYNKDRSIFSQIPLTQELAKLMGTNLKIYVSGSIVGDILNINKVMENMRW